VTMAAADLEPYPCGPTPDGYDTEYWESLRSGRLVLPRCDACGQWRALGRSMCSGCWSTAIRWDQVAPSGTVFTWIRTHRDFMSELDLPAPYVTVLVELHEAPVRLLGILTAGGDSVSIGAPVAGTFSQPDNAAWPVLRWEAT